MAARGSRARLRVPGDLRPHPRGRRGAGPHRPTTSAARARRSRPPTRSWRRSACCAGSSATSCPTGGSISPTTSSPSSTGCRPASTAASECPGAEMTKRVEEALRNPYVRCLSHPTGRYINRRPENALDLERIFELARDARRRGRGQRAARPARPERRARPRGAARRRPDRLLDRRALGGADWATWSSRSPPRAAGGPQPPTSSTPGRWRGSSAAGRADARQSEGCTGRSMRQIRIPPPTPRSSRGRFAIWCPATADACSTRGAPRSRSPRCIRTGARSGSRSAPSRMPARTGSCRSRTWGDSSSPARRSRPTRPPWPRWSTRSTGLTAS